MKITRGSEIKELPASHENIDDPGCLKKVLVKRGDLEEGNLQMINWSKLRIGKSFSLHYHESMSEIFIILNGKVELELDGERNFLNQGDLVIIPAGVKHKMWNRVNEEVNYIAMGIAHAEGGKTINV